MITYCAACGQRISRPKRFGGQDAGGERPFLCPECDRLAGSRSGSSENSAGADPDETTWDPPVTAVGD